MTPAAATVVSCPTVGLALSRVGHLPGAETAVLVDAGGRVTVATMTPFGPSMHAVPGTGPAAAAAILGEASRRGEASFLHACSPGLAGEIVALLEVGGTPVDSAGGERHDDAEASVAAFMGRRPDVPVTRTADGGARARGWSVAMYDPGVPVTHGMRLGLRAEPCAEGLALRWRDPGTGADMGLHAILPRARLTPSEAEEVAGAWAEVTTYAYGMARLPDGGQGRTVVLVLDVPRALDTGFRDGVRPRGGVPA